MKSARGGGGLGFGILRWGGGCAAVHAAWLSILYLTVLLARTAHTQRQEGGASWTSEAGSFSPETHHSMLARHLYGLPLSMRQHW